MRVTLKKTKMLQMRVKHHTLILDDNASRHRRSKSSIQGQLQEERKERGDRERQHTREIAALETKCEGLEKIMARQKSDAAAQVENMENEINSLHAQRAAKTSEFRKREDDLRKEVEDVRKEYDETVTSKERQLRSLRGKVTVLQARVSELNSRKIARETADTNELLRLQTWTATLERRLKDAESSREAEVATLREQVSNLGNQRDHAIKAAAQQVQAANEQVAATRKQMVACETRLRERTEIADETAAGLRRDMAALQREVDTSSARAEALIESFSKQELAWKNMESNYLRKIEDLKHKVEDVNALRKMEKHHESAMELQVALSDARAKNQAMHLAAAKDRHNRQTALNNLKELHARYEYDLGERNNTISRLQRENEKLQTAAFTAKASSEASERKLFQLQKELDDTRFGARTQRSKDESNKRALEDRCELAERSVKLLQLQLEKFL